MILIRSLVFALYYYASLLLCAVLGAPQAALSQRWAMAVPRAWARMTLFGMRWICGVKLVIEGREHVPTGPSIVAMKHLSTLETMFPFIMLKNPAIVIKQELSDIPLFGWHTQRCGAIPVARDTHASALRLMLRRARDEIAKGREIFIFPEGTRQEIDAPPDYKPGVAALYRDLAVAVTPVATNTGLVWPARGLLRYPGTVIVRFLPPIAPGLSRAEFMRRIEDDIETASQALLPAERRRRA